MIHSKITPRSALAPSKPISNSSIFFLPTVKTSLERFHNVSSPWQGQEDLVPHRFLNNGNYHYLYVFSSCFILNFLATVEVQHFYMCIDQLNFVFCKCIYFALIFYWVIVFPLTDF